jgi:hypothetical protein
MINETLPTTPTEESSTLPPIYQNLNNSDRHFSKRDVEKRHQFALLDSLNMDVDTHINPYSVISDILPPERSGFDPRQLRKTEASLGLPLTYDYAKSPTYSVEGSEENSENNAELNAAEVRNKKFGETVILLPKIFEKIGLKTSVEYPIYKAGEIIKSAFEKPEKNLTEKDQSKKNSLKKISSFAIKKAASTLFPTRYADQQKSDAKEIARKEADRQARGRSLAMKRYVESRKTKVN